MVKDVATIVQAVVVVAAALIGGGILAFWRFQRFRTLKPRVGISQRISHRPVAGLAHLSVEVWVSNGSRVLIRIRRGLILVQQIAPSTLEEVRVKWTQSFGQESGPVKLQSSTPFHCQAGTSSGVTLTSGWWTWFLPSSNTWAGVR